jgi:hypothetical protein
MELNLSLVPWLQLPVGIGGLGLAHTLLNCEQAERARDWYIRRFLKVYLDRKEDRRHVFKD